MDIHLKKEATPEDEQDAPSNCSGALELEIKGDSKAKFSSDTSGKDNAGIPAVMMHVMTDRVMPDVTVVQYCDNTPNGESYVLRVRLV